MLVKQYVYTVYVLLELQCLLITALTDYVAKPPQRGIIFPLLHPVETALTDSRFLFPVHTRSMMCCSVMNG